MNIKHYSWKIMAAGAVGMLFIGVILVIALSQIKSNDKKDANIMKIGVAIYKQDDTYISSVVANLETIAKKYEQENGIQIRLDVVDANESQNKQNDQIEQYLSLNYDVICINMVDRTEAAPIIDKAMDKGTPLIFFNREPVEEDMNKWDKIFYVGFDAKKSGELQAQIVIDIYNKNSESIDLNGDGIIQYIMLEGEKRHQDSLIRTEKSIQTLKDEGLVVEKLSGAIANWNRNQASALMDGFISEYGSKIELVICNNDDMALGAVDSFDKAIIPFINIVGIDATPPGIEAVEAGKMLGTVNISAKRLAETVFAIARHEVLGDSLENIELHNNTYVWVEQEAVIGLNN